MRSRWIHPLFKPSLNSTRYWAPRLGVCGSPLIRQNVSIAQFSPLGITGQFGSQSSESGHSSRYLTRSSVFLAVCLIAVLCTIGIGLVKAKRTSSPKIVGGKISTLDPFINGGVRDKVSFLSSLSVERRRELASQVHFLSHLMTRGRVSVSEEERTRLASTIVKESLIAGVDPLFVAAVINSESTFNRHAVSTAGAQGLMQIMPDTARYLSAKSPGDNWMTTSRLRDPSYNIRLGISYLKELQSTFAGDLELALIAYNWGPKNVSDALQDRKRIPVSSAIYARRIIHNHQRWNDDFSRNASQFRYMDVDIVS